MVKTNKIKIRVTPEFRKFLYEMKAEDPDRYKTFDHCCNTIMRQMRRKRRGDYHDGFWAKI